MIPADFSIPFSLRNPWKFPLYGLPLRCSVPFPAGELRDPQAELALVDEQEVDVGAQWHTLSTWSDGSVRFALLDYAAAELAPRATRHLTLRARSKTKPAKLSKPLRVRQTKHTIAVDTGRLRWVFSRDRFALAESAQAHNRDWLADGDSDLCVTDERGYTFRASAGDYAITIEQAGPQRAVIRIDGNHGRGPDRFMSYWLRLHFTRGGSQVLISHHLRNRHGGLAGRKVQRCWLEGSLAVAPTAARRLHHLSRGLMTQEGDVTCPERVDLDTDAVCVEIETDPFLFPRHPRELAWQAPATLLRNGDSLREDAEEICPSIYEKNSGRALSSDRRSCAPLIDIWEAGAGGVLIKFAMPAPAAEYPLHLASERNRFEVDFFPVWRQLHHFSEGMGKTREVLFNFHDDSSSAIDVFHESANLAYPGVVSPGAAAYRRAGFADMHRTLPYQPNKYPLLESKIDSFRSSAHGTFWPPALGWKHYGDEAGQRGDMQKQNVWQFINNEEDYLWCRMIDAWRRGAAYDGLSMARHLMDIDYIDYSDDPARDGATCPHSEMHVNGEVYPSHQWCQGLLYFHLATGDPEALRIAKRIGDCLIWFITGPRKQGLRASGRETAWPLLSLSALYEVTHEKRYRQAALTVVDDLIAIQAAHGSVCWEYPLGSGVFSAYMLAMTFNGIWDVWAATGEPRVLALWKQITKPVVDALDQPDSWGYVVFRNWHIKVADLTVLARWYELTGDDRYLRLGRNGLRLILSGAPQNDSMYQGLFAMWYRHIILFLSYADSAGLIDDDHCTLVW